MCVWERELWAQGEQGLWGGAQRAAPESPSLHAMTRQVMWPLVLTGALGSRKQEGSVLGPHACFIVCVGCLTAECRQINPETSASATECKLEAGQRPHCASPSLGTHSTAAKSISSSFICLCASSVSGSSFLLSCFTWWEEKGKYVSLFLSLSCSTVVHVLRAGCISNNN